jgi:hypothetical protein
MNMSQNIYDDPQFFAGYATLDRSVKGLDGAPEWPSCRQCCRRNRFAGGGSRLRLRLVLPLGAAAGSQPDNRF